MPKTNDKIGQKFGSLTVIDYPPSRNSPIKCRCDCGDERTYPKDILKPSYKAPRMCPMCAGHDCEICGKRVAYKGRRISATCSDACSKIRASNREKSRYQKIKSTQKFKESYAKKYAAHKAKMQTDVEYAKNFRAKAALQVAKFKMKLPQEKLIRIKQRNRRMMQIRDAFRDSHESTKAEKLEYQKLYYQKRRDRSALIIIAIHKKTTPH